MVNIILSGIIIILIFVTAFSIRECLRSRAYSETRLLFPLGIFVWGDALLITPFWIFVTFWFLITKNVFVVKIAFISFWLIRSLGEAIYWINEQFATNKKNKPEKFIHFRLLKNDSVYFVNQVFWQVITAVALTALILTSRNIW
ncbi:MAG TPA: hypothetical protein VI819_04850 [Patescibacteria group bacterium]|nr:hypothetical protein [Patescibacteria group bacterium]